MRPGPLEDAVPQGRGQRRMAGHIEQPSLDPALLPGDMGCDSSSLGRGVPNSAGAGDHLVPQADEVVEVPATEHSGNYVSVTMVTWSSFLENEYSDGLLIKLSPRVFYDSGMMGAWSSFLENGHSDVLLFNVVIMAIKFFRHECNNVLPSKLRAQQLLG